jgi:hypothetical protein
VHRTAQRGPKAARHLGHLLARGVTAAPTLHRMITLSRRHAVHHAAETVQRPSDAQAISSCAHEAVPSAALPVRERHSVPQPAAARRSPRGSPEALQPLQPTCPLITLRASCRAQRGRGGAKAARRSGRQLMRATGRAQRHSTSGGASQHAAARGVARGSPEAIRRLRRCPLSAGVLPRSARQGRP